MLVRGGLCYNQRMIKLVVTAVCDSVGIILPAEVLARLRAVTGDTLFLAEASVGYELSSHESKLAAQITVAAKVMREDYDALSELAK